MAKGGEHLVAAEWLKSNHSLHPPENYDYGGNVFFILFSSLATIWLRPQSNSLTPYMHIAVQLTQFYTLPLNLRKQSYSVIYQNGERDQPKDHKPSLNV